MNTLNPFPNKVHRKDPEHQYYHQDGTRYISVSKLLAQYYKAFDAKGASVGSAIKKMKADGVAITTASINRESKKLQEQWKQGGQDAADRGTIFHNAMEDYIGSGQITEPQWEKQIRRLAGIFSNYYQCYTEVIAYSEKAQVAGTMDVPILESPKNKILHIEDFKTNKKGIENVYQYSAWMYPPIDHLVDNKYTRYAIQQSLYAAMMEEHGYRIGTLSLIWINLEAMEKNEPVFWLKIPIPYLKHEAQTLLNQASITNYF
jgi:hypothetical protein